MSIALQELFDEKVRAFGVGDNNARFTADFISAINKVQIEIARRLDESTYYSDVATIEGTSDVDERYRDVLSEGVDAELWRRGHQQGADFSTSFQLYQQKLSEAFLDMMRTASNDAADDEADIIGLGYIEAPDDDSDSETTYSLS